MKCNEVSCIFFPGDASQRLLDSFTKELSLKERLVTEFTYCKNRDQLMVYLSLWLHEPLLNDDNDVLLESMLIETELRWHKNHTMENSLNVL